MSAHSWEGSWSQWSLIRKNCHNGLVSLWCLWWGTPSYIVTSPSTPFEVQESKARVSSGGEAACSCSLSLSAPWCGRVGLRESHIRAQSMAEVGGTAVRMSSLLLWHRKLHSKTRGICKVGPTRSQHQLHYFTWKCSIISSRPISVVIVRISLRWKVISEPPPPTWENAWWQKSKLWI